MGWRRWRSGVVVVALMAFGLAVPGAVRSAAAADPEPPTTLCVPNVRTGLCYFESKWFTVTGPSVLTAGLASRVTISSSIPECTDPSSIFFDAAGDAAKVPVPCYVSTALTTGVGSIGPWTPPNGTFPSISETGPCDTTSKGYRLSCPIRVNSVGVNGWGYMSGTLLVLTATDETGMGTPTTYGLQTVWRSGHIDDLVTYLAGVSAPPTVGISWSAAGAPGSFDFSANAAATFPATIARYDWDFGDGDVRPDAGPAPTKTWTGEAAERRVTLTVTDSTGRTATTTEILRPRLTITEAPVDPDEVRVGDTAALRVVVANDGPSTISGVATSVTMAPAQVATLAFGTSPAAATLAPGARQVFRVPFVARGEGTLSGTIDASGTSAAARIDATQREFRTVVGNPGLLVEMDAQVVEVGRSFALTMRVTNPGVDAVEDLVWSDPTGILLESGENPPAPEPSITHVRGPDLALPSRLEAGATTALVYVFNAPFTGVSVLTADVRGHIPADDREVSGKQAISVLVAAGWSEAARDLLAVEGIERALGAQVTTRALYERQLADQVSSSLGWTSSPDAETSLARDGIRQPGLRAMIAGVVSSGTDQAAALVEGWAEGFALGMDRFGRSGGETLANLWATAEDPVQRRLAAESIWSTMKSMPEATWTNLGYAGQAFLAAHTVEGLQTVVDANGALLRDVTGAVGEAMIGTPGLVVDYVRQYANDPVGAVRNLGRFGGDVTWKGSEAGMTTAVGEAGGVALANVGRPLLKGSLGLLRKGGTVVGDEGAALSGTAVVGEDAAEAMALRLAQAQQVVDNYQALAPGTVLDAATVTGRGGVLGEDVARIQSVIQKANERFGVPFELRARTQEVLSAGIDGIAKPEFVKPKAVSMLDQMMGADPGRAGRVGLFEPKPLEASVVARLDDANPGFAKMYEERLASQKKLWTEWQDPSSRLRVLTEAGDRYKDRGGITVLLDRPNNPVPFGVQYLEQLDEAAFLAAKGIDPADVPALKQQILASNVDTIRAAPTATPGPNGTVFIDEALSGKPFVSDLDIQSIVPAGGEWPAGVSRGQVITYFKAELSKLKRYPFHGWSDAAVDLPADYYMAAVPFQLGNADPALALQAANRVAGRLALLERLAREKADRLLASGAIDQARYDKMLKPFANLAALKDPATGLYSSNLLLKKFPPGEKTINFTAGDIRVGYGTGGQ